MGKLHELTATEKGVIIGCRLSGKSIREIAVITGHPKSTVGNIVKRYEKEGHVNNQSREGRPQLMNERDKRRLVRVVVQNRHKSFSQIAAAYNEEAIIENNLGIICKYMKSLENEYCWELILVDDGSTDNTGGIADKFSKNCDNIKIIHQTQLPS